MLKILRLIRLTSWGDGEWWMVFDFSYIISCHEWMWALWMKESNQITQMWLVSDFLDMNLFYFIIYKSHTCTQHVFLNFPNWWRQTSVHIVMTSRRWWLEDRVSWNYFFYYFDSFSDLNLLGYYVITYRTEIRHYFVILKFSTFPRLK